MSLDLTFKSVCDTIKKHGKEDAKLLEAVDRLLGLALICSPAVFGPTAAALLPTLAVKNELIKIGKSVFEKLTKNNLISKKTPLSAGAALGMVGSPPQLSEAADAVSSD